MNEDLRNWRPHENTEYNGFERRDRHGHMKRGYTIIYFKKGDELEEHYGDFDIISDQVKIWYVLNGQKIQKFVPRPICEFSKTRSGHTTYYHLIINQDNAKIGVNMANAGNNDRGYGLNRKPDEDEEVEFKVPQEKVGILGRLTGRSSAIYLKKRYEDKLNEIWRGV